MGYRDADRTVRARAKINLALHVRARREDGYHDLETLFAFVEHGDAITIRPSARSRITYGGAFAREMVIAPGSNLIFDAAKRFHATFGGADTYVVDLRKEIPLAAGLGGGSADAAATLRHLAGLHGIAADDPRLYACAEALGADVPACLLGRTAIGTGKGEQLTPVAGPTGMPVLLVNPRVAVPTGPVFAGWDGVDRGPLGHGDALAVALAGRNDLEAPARAMAPVIGDVLDLLARQDGARLVRMSGSGATCFALFDDAADCAAAAAAIQATQPGWWVQPTTLV